MQTCLYMKIFLFRESLLEGTDHILAGFSRLFCLVPYEVISIDLWNQVMPHWMEAIRHDIPPERMSELRIIFR